MAYTDGRGMRFRPCFRQITNGSDRPGDQVNVGRVIVLTRFRVPSSDDMQFAERARAAVAVLQTRAGFLSSDLGRNVDDPDLWTVTTRWQNVGSYRRALQGNESKMVVVPLLSLAIDEPTAYEEPEFVGENLARETP
jgi:quinol monooxygenase YgiN